MSKLESPEALPALISALKRQVVEVMGPGNEEDSAHEVLDTLDIAWIAAARWRAERAEPSLG